MAALRERYSTRDGVGHASRPRFDDALSLDAQSGSLCLSSARRRRHSNSNANSHCDGNSDGNSDADIYTRTEGYTVAEAASYATAATVRALPSK